MTPDDYGMLLARLDRPTVRRVENSQLLERLHPHRPAADPEWQAPGGTPGTSYREVRDLLRRLRHPQHSICALVAIEMVLPIHERWTATTDIPVPPALRRATKQAWECIRGDLDWDLRIKDRVLRWRDVAIEAGGKLAVFVASAVASAYSSVNRDLFPLSGMRTDQATFSLAAAAVDEAFQAWLLDRVADEGGTRAWELASQSVRDRFHEEWWDRCRCRLAFRDAPAAILV